MQLFLVLGFFLQANQSFTAGCCDNAVSWGFLYLTICAPYHMILLCPDGF